MLSDHSAVHCKLRPKKPPLERVEISYRKLRSTNKAVRPSDNQRLSSYGSHWQIRTHFDRNTSKACTFKRRMITLRPFAPWYHEGISDAKRKRRKLERQWRLSRLCVDRQMYVDQFQVVNKMLRDAKASYYSPIILENASDPKILFNAVDKLLHRRVDRRYPKAPSTIELTPDEQFCRLFWQEDSIHRNGAIQWSYL